MVYSDSYHQKIDSCLSSINLLESDIDQIIDKYKDTFFSESEKSKFEIFKQVTTKNLSIENVEFLNKKGGKLTHHKDSREGYEYLTDLMLGWFIEDAIISKLNTLQIKSELSGNDRFRDFLSPRKISTQPDIQIGRINKRTLEITSDWKNTWNKYNHADFRDSKFDALIKKKSIIFGISPIEKLGFVIDLPKDKKIFGEKQYIFAYKKFGYTIKNIKDYLMPLNNALKKIEKIFMQLN